MKLIETNINGVFIIEPKVFEDTRGYFFESWSEAKLAEAIRQLSTNSQTDTTKTKTENK